MSNQELTRKYFVKERRLLKIFGVSFTGNESVAYKAYSFMLLSLVNFTYPVLNISEIFRQDMEVAADILIYVFATCLSACKTMVLLRNRIKIGRILDKLEDEPFTVNLERGGYKEKGILNRYIWIANAQTRIYWISACLGFTTAFLNTAFNWLRSKDCHNLELPFGPLSVLNNTQCLNFEITWLYQSCAFASITAHFVSADLIMANILVHISGQFKMLQNNLRRIVSNSLNKMKMLNNDQLEGIPSFDCSLIPLKILQDSLKDTVLYHLAILDLASEMEDVFSGLFLAIFLGTLGLLSLIIYRISGTSNAQVVLYCLEIVIAYIQVGVVCFWGEQIIHKSQNVANAAFKVDFAGTDVQFQKGIVMVIRRSQKVARITAGKFTEIGLTSFVWVIRTSYSAFMVLRTFNIGGR